jgi:hypothetical protein
MAEEVTMVRYASFVFAAAAAATLAAMPLRAPAQVSINIGPAPDCPYGYYDFAPYACAPYGYYGSEWFLNGVFVGAGPWFHGPRDFHGHIDNHFDTRHGYRGPLPRVGDRRNPSEHPGRVAHFHGNEVHDGRGHGRPG